MFGRKIVRRTIFRPKNSSAEQLFGRKQIAGKKISDPTKFVHANRGGGYCTVRFDVYVFGRKIVRPKTISFGRKILLVRPKKCFSEFWRPDCHESVTHLRDFTEKDVVGDVVGMVRSLKRILEALINFLD
jgi:hypothetical protein